MSNKERLIANNAKIEEIRQALARKQVSPTDMLQARVDEINSCKRLFYQYGGTDLSFIGGLDTSNVTDMERMFYECTNVTNVNASNFNTSNVTNMFGMFEFCQKLKELDLSSFNTKKVTNMANMFNSCNKLTSLDLSNWDTSSVTNMGFMFSYCQKLTSLDLSSFNTNKVTNMAQMFNGCQDLTSVIGELDLISVTNITRTFENCYDLENITLKNIKKSIQLGVSTVYGKRLSNDSLINTIQQLWDLTGSTSQKLTLSTDSKNNIANIYVKLIDVTDEMLATDPYAGNKKPCVVCESTDEGAMTITEYLISKNWSLA